MTSASQLKRLSLEELLSQEVMIVTRRSEMLSTSPSAVQVITGEEVRRSGAQTLAQALRLAPNLQVAQVDSRNWAVTARGFNQPGGLANKLLVMIDGRTIYTPLFAGVFWDVQHLLLEDLERIEVVSGPGGTLWGANAVNGVINIVTKNSAKTQGLLLEGGAGSFVRDYGAIRYGGSHGTNLFFRVYAMRMDHNETSLTAGGDATNSWDNTQGGLRVDWNVTSESTLTVQGDVYSGSFEQPQPGDVTVDGQNLLGRWVRRFSDESDLRVQMFFDRTWRRIPGTFAEDLKTYDIDLQHRFQWGERQNIMWGAGYRLYHDEVNNGATLAFLPADKDLHVISGFLQDEIVLVPERLFLTIGTKVEHNDYSGVEVQPSGRLAWQPHPQHTVWGAISRAVRTPSRIDREFFVPGGGPPFVLAGGTNFSSEKLLAYELGYRVRPMERLSFSLAGFYNSYDDVRSVETNSTGTLIIMNGLKGQSWGAEIASDLQATRSWRLRGGYTYFHKHIWEKPGHGDVNNRQAEGNDPRHQVLLQSLLTIPRANMELDATARFVDELPSPHVPAYFTFDLRLGWRPCPNVEFSLVGKNLWDNRHPEFGPSATRHEIPRSIFGKVTWRF